jgi:hypothetical protein
MIQSQHEWHDTALNTANRQNKKTSPENRRVLFCSVSLAKRSNLILNSSHEVVEIHTEMVLVLEHLSPVVFSCLALGHIHELRRGACVFSRDP